MKKKWGMILVLLCSFILAINVWADDGGSQSPEYATDYYMIVQSPDGGVDIYSEADPESNKLNDEQIVNGTAIHIKGEKTGTDDHKWGYTQYHGMNGYVPMNDLNPTTRSKAVESECKTFGSKEADFDVKVHSDDGSAELYNGPGEKFDKVSGTDGIENGTSVHISQRVQGEDGSSWGKADTDPEGWLNLDRDTDYKSGEKNTVTPTPTAEVTVTPTPTAEVTATPTPTVAVTATPIPTVTKEATATPTEKINTEQNEKKVSGKNVSASAGFNSPVIWISIVGIIIIIVLIIYFLKKKK